MIITNLKVKNIPFNMDVNELRTKVAVGLADANLYPSLHGWSKNALETAKKLIHEENYTAAMAVYDDVLDGRKTPEAGVLIQKKYQS